MLKSVYDAHNKKNDKNDRYSTAALKIKVPCGF